MKVLSKASVYGIRAVLYVASLGAQQRYVPIRQISEDLKISFHFLTKIMQTLNQRQIITSYRGPHGGVCLAKPPDEITLMDIISAIEDRDYFQGCILALPRCGEQTPCPLHAYWSEVRDNMRLIFENTNLAQLEKQITNEGLRIMPN